MHKHSTPKAHKVGVHFNDDENKPDSPNFLNTSLAVCRICHSSERSCPYGKSGGPLISPCLCKGTMGLFHRICLSQWLETSKTRSCEICKFTFEVKRIKRGFCSYMAHRDARIERKNMITDFICFLILTPLAFLAAGLCSYGSISHHTAKANIGDVEEKWLDPPSAEVAICLMILTLLLMFTYTTWLVITFMYHFRMFRLWQNANQKLYVMDQMDEQESIWVNGNRSQNWKSRSIASFVRRITPARFYGSRRRNNFNTTFSFLQGIHRNPASAPNFSMDESNIC